MKGSLVARLCLAAVLLLSQLAYADHSPQHVSDGHLNCPLCLNAGNMAKALPACELTAVVPASPGTGAAEPAHALPSFSVFPAYHGRAPPAPVL